MVNACVYHPPVPLSLRRRDRVIRPLVPWGRSSEEPAWYTSRCTIPGCGLYFFLYIHLYYICFRSKVEAWVLSSLRVFPEWLGAGEVESLDGGGSNPGVRELSTLKTFGYQG